MDKRTVDKELRRYKVLALEIRQLDTSIKEKKRQFQALKGEIFSLMKKSKEMHIAFVDELIK